VVNGTAALHLCVKLAGVVAGDEMLVPSLTFVATANAVSYCDAIPHFVDCDDATLGVDAAKLALYLEKCADLRGDTCYNRATGRRIRALIVMHTFGNPAELDALAAVCRRFGLVMIEDAAEALGSTYRGRHAGNHGLMSALSFNGNKVVTTGGGGALLTSDAELGRHARHLSTTARLDLAGRFVHDEVGYNYRLPNLNAALGCAQLEQLADLLDKKRRLAARYRAAFANIAGARLFSPAAHTNSNHWLNTLIIERADVGERDEILGTLNAAGIQARSAWALMHHLPMYRDCPRMDLTVAESLERRIVNLPSSAHLASVTSG
jgi:perosamine synthetase